MWWRLKQLRNRDEGLYIASRPTDVYCDVQSRCANAALFLADELVDESCTSSSRFCTLRWTACRSVILDLVEPVLQLRRVPMELDSDLAEGVDPAGTLRFFVIILAMLLLAAEVEGHCATVSNYSLHRYFFETNGAQEYQVNDGSQGR